MSHLTWRPLGGVHAVVFPPVATGAETLAYAQFFQNGGAETAERLIAVVRSWEDRFGAELVQNWGTFLQFVTRPPQTFEEAYELAVEQVLVASDTTIMAGVPIRRHAQALVDCATWYLRYQP